VTPKQSKLLHWYTVTAETLRGWSFVVILVVLGVVGFFGYRILNEAVLEREVARVIQEAEDLLRTVRDEGAINSYREEYFVARGHLEEAKQHRAAEDLQEAFRSADFVEAIEVPGNRRGADWRSTPVTMAKQARVALPRS
jgi:predicted negative regulator of RcsB-dependent stress response